MYIISKLIQAQIKLCCGQYSDIVVWREKELLVQRTYPDKPFISVALELAARFVKTAVLPELVGKWFTKEANIVSSIVTGSGKIQHFAIFSIYMYNV